MDRNTIVEKVTTIFRDVLDEDSLVLNDNMTAADVEAWDSLAHMQIISEIEDEFGISFTLGEVNGFKNVGELLSAIERHLA